MITNQTEHCVDRNRTNEEPEETLIVRFSINSSLVLFSLLFSTGCFVVSVSPLIIYFFYIFACFLEGKLKKTKPDQTKQKKKWINISIWATAHLPLPKPNIHPKLLSIDCCWVRGGEGGQLTGYWNWSKKISESVTKERWYLQYQDKYPKKKKKEKLLNIERKWKRKKQIPEMNVYFLTKSVKGISSWFTIKPQTLKQKNNWLLLGFTLPNITVTCCKIE